MLKIISESIKMKSPTWSFLPIKYTIVKVVSRERMLFPEGIGVENPRFYGNVVRIPSLERYRRILRNSSLVFPYLRTEMSHLSASTEIRHCLCMARHPQPTPPINNTMPFFSFHRFPSPTFLNACYFPAQESLLIFITEAWFREISTSSKHFVEIYQY